MHDLPRASRVEQGRYFYHMYPTATEKCFRFHEFLRRIDPLFFFFKVRLLVMVDECAGEPMSRGFSAASPTADVQHLHIGDEFF